MNDDYQDDLDELFDECMQNPEFVRVYYQEVIEENAQFRAICRYLRGEVKRLEGELDDLQSVDPPANDEIWQQANVSYNRLTHGDNS